MLLADSVAGWMKKSEKLPLYIPVLNKPELFI